MLSDILVVFQALEPCDLRVGVFRQSGLSHVGLHSETPPESPVTASAKPLLITTNLPSLSEQTCLTDNNKFLTYYKMVC